MTRSRSISPVPILLAAGLLAATPAAAQLGTGSALRGHDTRAPIDIDAGRIEVRDRDNQAIFTGDVRVEQGQMTLSAARMRVFYDPGKGGAPIIRRLDADGAVQLQSPSERVNAGLGVYDVEHRQLTFLRSVVLTRGDSVLRGSRLVIDLDNGRSTLDGAASAGPESRVTGRFVVPERTQQ